MRSCTFCPARITIGAVVIGVRPRSPLVSLILIRTSSARVFCSETGSWESAEVRV